MENNAGSEEQPSKSQASDDKPGLTQLRKSWGFRRSTLARREFMEEVGDITHSPPPARRLRGRRLPQTTPTSDDNKAAQSPEVPQTVVEDLEWSASSSPVSEETKPALAPAGGCLDPSMWQDIGSAFHTAFTLLGGDDDLPVELSQSLALTDILGVGNVSEVLSPQTADETEESELVKSKDNVGTLQPVVSDEVTEADVNNVVLISSPDEDKEDMPLIETKEQLDFKPRQGGRARRGGRGKARGRGRGKGKGRGRGRGRAKALEVEEIVADEDDDDDDVILVNPSDAPSVPAVSPIQQTSPDCIIIDTNEDLNTDITAGQYDDASDEEGKQGDSVIKHVMEHPSISDSKGYDPNALYCICRQKHDKRFMISCDSCQEYFHGDCVGVSESEGCKEYICPPCTTKQLSLQLQSECHSQALPEISPEVLSLSPSGEEPEGKEEWETLKKTVDLEVNHIEKVLVIRPEAGTEPEGEMETDCSGPMCIGPGCSKPALQESVYCGNDCIVQHATVTMKSFSDTNVSNPRGQLQKKAPAVMPTAKGQSSSRVSARLAVKAEEHAKEEELMEVDGSQTEETSSIACDPTLTGVQATPQPSPKFYTASSKECKQNEDETPQEEKSEDPSTDACPSPQPVSEPVVAQSNSESIKSHTSVETTEESDSSIPPIKTSDPQSQTTLKSEHNETKAVLNSLTSYVIPKKQSGLQPSSSHMAASSQKPPVPALLNETRNLPVPPAPSAPPSRPSQPNNQVRQSIQRSLTSILYKRVCDCEELDMSESDAAKLVASIEVEMFDIFRNTDSKYMNKYRTIMFNLKDPKNKGLLYRVVQGDISPFRLVRMSQKDMQATKAPDHNMKDASGGKDAAAKAPSLLQQPEAVKVDLSCLNITKPDKRPVGNKRNLSTPTPKNRISEPSKRSALPDVLTCMLKDTTSEHKAHLFDLKCKICTGQIGEDEPPSKKNKASESSEKPSSWWRKSAGDDSPLRAPPDLPDSPDSSDFDYSSSSNFDPSSRLVIDTSDFAVVESPASPVKDSATSSTLESPASPVKESPASPVSDTSNTTSKRTYTPVVIPAVSTVTITRRDPRTAASRSYASSCSASGPTCALTNQSAPYAPLTEDSSTKPKPSVLNLPAPPTKPLPKSILMKPADPRLYGTSSRNAISDSRANGETSQFLAKQEVLWKGFLNMLTVSKFATKGYLVSGPTEPLKSELPDSIEIGGRIMPQTVWDYVAKLKTNITKELCVIRFHPATEEEEVAYVSLFSYFSSRGRFGVVSNNSRSIKDVYIVPLSAEESVPSILQPLEGPGLEKNRPNLLLGLAIIQKVKRSGCLLQEMEEKKSKPLSKDPMWIPKPPVLYGSDKLEVFQPYGPETPTSTTTPVSPPRPGSPSDFSSNAKTQPSHQTSFKSNTTVSTSGLASSTQSTSSNVSDTNMKEPSDSPLSTILNALFKNKQNTAKVSNEEHCTTNVTTAIAKVSVLSHVSCSMMDPIVQQYGQKSKVKDIVEENAFDRPYDPEEEYDPAIGYGTISSQSKGNNNSEDPPLSSSVDDDVAYDPEDETIFQDLQRDAKKPTQTKTSSCPTSFPISTPVGTPSVAKTTPQTSSLTSVPQNLPTGTVVVSAATLTEQQRMLEELNKQIEEQKRQLKEQEEALRQQREAVGMFMAQFSGTDSMMSSPSKSLPLSQVTSLQSGKIHSESRHSESKDSKPQEAHSRSETVEAHGRESQTERQKGTDAIPCLNITSVAEQAEVSDNRKDNEKSSAGEIEESDVPYDPEDELFNEIQDDVFQAVNTKIEGSSLPRQYASPIAYHSKRRRSSPKRRSHRERDRCRSPSRRSQQRSVSRSRKHRERDRHRKSERDRSKHRTRDHSERQTRHHKSHSTRRHSHDRRPSPSPPSENDLMSHAPKEFRASTNITEKQTENQVPLKCELNPDVRQCEPSKTTYPPLSMKNTSDECNLKSDICNQDILQENLPNLKLETSQPPKFNEPLINKESVPDNSVNVLPAQMNKQLGTSGDKFENSIPLRESDPPLRDSPESPDPDPRFIKQSSEENNPSTECDKIIDCQTPISNLTPAVEVKKFQLPLSQETLLNIPPHFEGTSIGNLIFKALNIQSADSGKLNVTKEESEGKYLDQKHSEIQSQGAGSLNPAVEISNSSGPEVGQGLKCSRMGNDPEQDTKVINLTVDENMSQSQQPASEQGVRDIGGSPNQGRISDLTINLDDPGIKIKSFLQVNDLQQHQRDVDLILRPCDPESSSKSNLSTYSDDRHLCTASQVMSDEKHQNEKCLKKEETSMRRPGPTINYGHFPSSTSCTGQESVESAHHFKEAQYHIKFERSVHSLDIKLSESLHDQRRHDVREVCSLVSGQGMACMGGQDFSHGVDSHVPDRGIGETLKDRNYVNIQGIKHDQCPERTNEKNCQQDQYALSNIKADWQTEKTGPSIHNVQNMELFECKTYVDWKCPGSVGETVRIGQDRQDEGKVHQPGWRGTAMESHDPEKIATGFIDPCKPLVEMGGTNVGPLKHDIRRPGGSDVAGPREEMMYPDVEVPVYDRREPGSPDFTRAGTDFRGPNRNNWNGPERLGGDMRIAFHRREPGFTDFRAQEPNIGNPAMVDRARDMNTVGPDLREPRPENKHPAINSLGYGVRGPGVPDHLGSCFERGVDGGGPGPVHDSRGQRGPGDHDVRGLGPDGRKSGLECPTIDTKGLAGSHFSGPGIERRESSIYHPDVERNRSECPDFSRMEPREERGLPFFAGPGRERIGGNNQREHGFKRSSVEDQVPSGAWRDQHPDDLGHNKHGPSRPAWDPQSERRNPNMEAALHDWRGPDIRGPGSETDDPGPDNRRHQPLMEKRMIEARIPNQPGVQHMENTEFPDPDREEMRYSSVFSDRRGTDNRFGGMRNPNIEGLGPDRREPEDRDRQNRNFERDPGGPGPNWRNNGPSFMGPGNRQNNRSDQDNREDPRNRRKCDLEFSHEAKWKGTDCRYPAPDHRGPDAEKRWSDGRETQFKNELNRQDNRYRRPIPEGVDVDVFEYNTGGPCNAPRGPVVREHEHTPDWTPSGPRRIPDDDWDSPDCRDPRPFQDHADMGCARPDRVGPGNDCRETGRGGAEPRWGSENMDCRQQGHERRVPVGGVRGRRGPSMERHRGVPNRNDSFRNKREDEMQDNNDRRGIGDRNIRHNENLYLERPGSDGRILHPRAIEREREDLDVEGPMPGGQRAEPGFRMPDSDVRRVIHNRIDMRGAPDNQRQEHGPGGWETDTQVPVWNRRGEDKMAAVLDSREPNPAAKGGMKFPDTRGRGRYNRRGLSSRGRNPRQKCQEVGGPQRGNWGSSENPQSQQGARSPKARAGLLPTPTEGRLCLPNHKMSNPRMFSIKQKQIGRHMNRQWIRGRSFSPGRHEAERGPADVGSSNMR
ncbi:uncharacterized protein LOC144013606 isoform X1 [Festucalex cinctus]